MKRRKKEKRGNRRMIRLLINRKSIGGIIECGERDFDNKMTRFVPSRYARELKAFEALVRGRCLEMALQSNWVGHATLRVDPPPPLLLVRKPPVFSGTRSLYSPFLPSPPPPSFSLHLFPFPGPATSGIHCTSLTYGRWAPSSSTKPSK